MGEVAFESVATAIPVNNDPVVYTPKEFAHDLDAYILIAFVGATRKREFELAISR